MSSPILRAVAWAQRRSQLVPAPARRVANRFVKHLAGGAVTAPPSEDWSRPLIPGRPSFNLEDLLPRQAAAAAPTTRPPVTVREPVLRCAVAVGVLDVGGGEEVATFLARNLPAHGFETMIIHSGTRLAGQEGAGGRLVQAMAEAGVGTFDLTPDTVDAWFAEHRPDIVGGHYAPDWMLEAAVRAGVPWVETLHGMHSFLAESLWPPERTRSQHIAAQISISAFIRRQYLAGNPGYPGERIFVVPNGIETSRYVAIDSAQARQALGLADEFLFVSLARCCLQKNTYGLVEAFAEVARARDDVHLLIAGRPDDRLYFEHVRHLVSRTGVDGQIHLRGHCANVAALLAAADGFVLDSFFEGAIPLAAMQALVNGVPVVMSDVAGASEHPLWQDRRGYVVANPGGDPELVDWRRMGDLRLRRQANRDELVAAMLSVVDERAEWSRRRSALKESAARLFLPEDSVRGHAEVLRTVALRSELPA